MSSRLEQFIKENKQAFDSFEPPIDLWNNIKNELKVKPKQAKKTARLVKLRTVLQIAALFAIILTSGILYVRFQQKSIIDISQINPQLAKQQTYYASLIEDKRNELKQIEKADPYLYQEFSAEINKMNENYKKLNKDLITSPNQEETVKAMIRNLQAQIDLLNQQLSIIKQINEFKKENDDTQSI